MTALPRRATLPATRISFAAPASWAALAGVQVANDRVLRLVTVQVAPLRTDIGPSASPVRAGIAGTATTILVRRDAWTVIA
jgi:hypothetical protein